MKFERIYSPREKLIRVRLNVRYASRRYRVNHPERARRSYQSWRERNPDYREDWKRRNPGKDQLIGKRRVREMRPCYLAQQLRQSGRPVTPENLALKRAELTAYRSRKVARILYASATIN